LREGEFVAVTKYGQVSKLTERNTGRDFKETQELLNQLGPQTRGVVETQAAHLQARQLEEQRREAQRLAGTRGGMVSQQMEALEKAKEYDERRRKEDERARTGDRGGDKEPELDLARFRTDKSYRREFMGREQQKTAEERSANRAERGAQAQQDRDRQR
jgi:hypothetical protein